MWEAVLEETISQDSLVATSRDHIDGKFQR